MADMSVWTKGDLRARTLGVLAYMGVLCFIPLMVGRSDDFVRFHARQGLVLWGLSVLAGFIFFVPGIGKLVFSVTTLLVVVYSLIGIISVVLRRAWKLPVVHTMAENF